MDFEEWFKKADRICARLIGLSLDDLSDGPSWDSWDAGITPQEYVRDRLAEEGIAL